MKRLLLCSLVALSALLRGPAVRAERDYISFNGTGKDNSITVSKPDSAGKQRRVA